MSRSLRTLAYVAPWMVVGYLWLFPADRGFHDSAVFAQNLQRQSGGATTKSQIPSPTAFEPGSREWTISNIASLTARSEGMQKQIGAMQSQLQAMQKQQAGTQNDVALLKNHTHGYATLTHVGAYSLLTFKEVLNHPERDPKALIPVIQAHKPLSQLPRTGPPVYDNQ